MRATSRESRLQPAPVSFMSEPQDLSLVLGGPLFQLLRRFHLEGDALELVHRRVIAAVLITWFPLLLLSTFPHVAGESARRISFYQDIEVHLRFLVALPLLILAELVVHARIRPAVRRFIELRLVLSKDVPAFERAIKSALRIRNSVYVELGLLVLVFAVGPWLWNTRSEVNFAHWYTSAGAWWRLNPAGYWYVFVSIPIFQFILLRWYMRFFIWSRFLWQVSRLDLNLLPTHPDRCGGLSFLGKSAYAFGPILFAQGALLAGLIAGRVLYGHESLLSFKVQIVGFVLFFVVVVLGPLLMFTPRLARAKRQGLADYGLLAQRYVEGFDQKWVRNSPGSEELLGTGDIQSLADLGNSYEIVRQMRPVPFGLQDAARLAIATAAPITPLLLTIFSPEELILRIIKIVM